LKDPVNGGEQPDGVIFIGVVNSRGEEHVIAEESDATLEIARVER